MVPVTKYVICETNALEHENNAGPKARIDISQIALSSGWKPLVVRSEFPQNRFSAFVPVFNDYARIAHSLRRDDILLLQFPLGTYLPVSIPVLPLLRLAKRKGVKIIEFIHDLDSFRGYSNYYEKHYFALADVLIAHNERMKAYLEQRYDKPIVSLEIFDYLVPNPAAIHRPESGIDIAGTLDPSKAKYVYKTAAEIPDAPLNLYGIKFAQSSPARKWYRGEYAPDALLAHLIGKFGLVWDGASTETCSGIYGKYLKYNDPHKLSLYLASNKPIFIWDQAAEADFVREHHVGFTVPTIADAIQKFHTLTSDEYSDLQNNAQATGARLRDGYYTRQAISKSLEVLG